MHALLLAGVVLPLASVFATEPPVETPIVESDELARWAGSRDERMAWWREARFGMFVHWGLYSPAGGYWNGKRYEQHYAE